MRFSKGNLILILVFVGGIIMPTAILTFLGFRNIQNEMFLAQKNFDENQAALQKDIEDAIAKEQEKETVRSAAERLQCRVPTIPKEGRRESGIGP